MAVKSKSGSAKSAKPTTEDELRVENVQSDGDVEETQTTPVEVNESGAGTTNGKADEVDPLTSGAPTYGEDIKGASSFETDNQRDEFSETKQLAVDSSDAQLQANGDESDQDEAAEGRVESGQAEAEAQGVAEEGAGEGNSAADESEDVDTSEL